MFDSEATGFVSTSRLCERCLSNDNKNELCQLSSVISSVTYLKYINESVLPSRKLDPAVSFTLSQMLSLGPQHVHRTQTQNV